MDEIVHKPVTNTASIKDCVYTWIGTITRIFVIILCAYRLLLDGLIEFMIASSLANETKNQRNAREPKNTTFVGSNQSNLEDQLRNQEKSINITIYQSFHQEYHTNLKLIPPGSRNIYANELSNAAAEIYRKVEEQLFQQRERISKNRKLSFLNKINLTGHIKNPVECFRKIALDILSTTENDKEESFRSYYLQREIKARPVRETELVTTQYVSSTIVKDSSTSFEHLVQHIERKTLVVERDIIHIDDFLSSIDTKLILKKSDLPPMEGSARFVLKSDNVNYVKQDVHIDLTIKTGATREHALLPIIRENKVPVFRTRDSEEQEEKFQNETFDDESKSDDTEQLDKYFFSLKQMDKVTQVQRLLATKMVSTQDTVVSLTSTLNISIHPDSYTNLKVMPHGSWTINANEEPNLKEIRRRSRVLIQRVQHSERLSKNSKLYKLNQIDLTGLFKNPDECFGKKHGVHIDQRTATKAAKEHTSLPIVENKMVSFCQTRDLEEQVEKVTEHVHIQCGHTDLTNNTGATREHESLTYIRVNMVQSCQTRVSEEQDENEICIGKNESYTQYDEKGKAEPRSIIQNSVLKDKVSTNDEQVDKANKENKLPELFDKEYTKKDEVKSLERVGPTIGTFDKIENISWLQTKERYIQQIISRCEEESNTLKESLSDVKNKEKIVSNMQHLKERLEDLNKLALEEVESENTMTAEVLRKESHLKEAEYLPIEISKMNKSKVPYSSKQYEYDILKAIRLRVSPMVNDLKVSLTCSAYVPWPQTHDIILPTIRQVTTKAGDLGEYFKRLNSFLRGENQHNRIWNNEGSVWAGPLVAAGFSYDGEDDIVVCRQCGCKSNTQEWKDNDEEYAFEMHKQEEIGNCPFLRTFGPK